MILATWSKSGTDEPNTHWAVLGSAKEEEALRVNRP